MNPFLTGKRGFYHSLQEKAIAREMTLNKIRELGGLPAKEKSDPFPFEPTIIDVGYPTREFYQRMLADYHPVGVVGGRGYMMNATVYDGLLDDALEIRRQKIVTSFESFYRELEEARKPKTNQDALSLLNKGDFDVAPSRTRHHDLFVY